jgi:GNAT superfamily N-acetyltransferase
LSHAAATKSLSVRRAQDGEARACRHMMPDLFAPHHAPDLWVAVEGGALVGAAGISWHRTSEPSGFPVYAHVEPAARRRGIATALVTAIAEAARDDAPCLNSWFDVAPDSDAAAFLAATGFACVRQVFEFEAEMKTFYDLIKVTYDRFAKRGKLTADFHIVSLAEAPADQVAALVADNFALASASALARVVEGTSSHDPEKSVALLKDGQVLGALLYSWNGGDIGIDAWVVAEEARGTSANLMLVEAASRRALEAGAWRFRFSCTDDVRDTINLARRGGARQTAIKSRFSKTL